MVVDLAAVNAVVRARWGLTSSASMLKIREVRYAELYIS